MRRQTARSRRGRRQRAALEEIMVTARRTSENLQKVYRRDRADTTDSEQQNIVQFHRLMYAARR